MKANTELNSKIVVERLGGYVRYPNGQKLPYFVGTGAMPRVGGRYVFFLDASSPDLSIITAYEFKGGKVIPLDLYRQFDQYRGFDEAVFLSELNKVLVKP